MVEVSCLDNMDYATDSVENEDPCAEVGDNAAIDESATKDIEAKGKKKKAKDDTQQPIYACEECTSCFTTIADLKVFASSFKNCCILYGIMFDGQIM